MNLNFSGRWIPVTERLPDDDITVMLHGHAMDEPWCLGYRDAGIWRGVDDYAIGAKITHWADLVPGPQAAPAEPQPTCVWREEDPWGPMPDTYATDCGEMWSFVDGGPNENRVKFCHRCGKTVKVVPYQQPVDDDAAPGVPVAHPTQPEQPR